MFRSLTKILAVAASMSFAGALDDIQAPWTEILAANVKGDRVDYAGVQKDRAKLQAYFKSLASLDSNVIKTASKEERAALYINAFNAGVFELILRNPSKGAVFTMPLELSGAKFLVVAAESLSVHDVLRKKIMDPSQDPRYWALICDGSMSSAPILNHAVLSSGLESLSEERMRLWLADTVRNKIDAKRTLLSQIPFDDFRGKPEFRNYPDKIPGLIKKFGPPGADAVKNHPEYFFNASKNSVQVAPAPKGKGKHKK